MTDFGPGSTDPIDLLVDVSYFGPNESKYRDDGGYALGEAILTESGSPDFSDCKMKNYELKMGYDAAFNCFTRTFSSDICETRRNAIKTVSGVQFYRMSYFLILGVEYKAFFKCSMEYNI